MGLRNKQKSATDLINKLKTDYPSLIFSPGKPVRWSPSEQTIYYDNDPANLLHEVGHALLDHEHYHQDAELLIMERQAWDKAQEICNNYSISIDDDVVEEALDSYRNWLYSRSICPRCQQSGIQSNDNLLYKCLNCQTLWRPNAAKSTHLRRHRIKNVSKTKNTP